MVVRACGDFASCTADQTDGFSVPERELPAGSGRPQPAIAGLRWFEPRHSSRPPYAPLEMTLVRRPCANQETASTIGESGRVTTVEESESWFGVKDAQACRVSVIFLRHVRGMVHHGLIDSSRPPLPILVGVDGSSGSRTALDYAVCRARLTGLRLEVLTAYDPFAGASTSEWNPGGSFDGARIAVTARRRAEDVIAEVDTTDVDLDHRVVPGRREAVFGAKSAFAALVVIGAPRPGFWRRLFAGSSLGHHLLRHAQCPVVVVPLGWTPPLHSAHPMAVSIDQSAGIPVLNHYQVDDHDDLQMELLDLVIRPIFATSLAVASATSRTNDREFQRELRSIVARLDHTIDEIRRVALGFGCAGVPVAARHERGRREVEKAGLAHLRAGPTG